MGSETISTRLIIEGEEQYRQALKACVDQLSAMKSQLALVQSEYQGTANKLEALTAKGDALNTMYEKQQQRVQTTASALENAQKAQAEYAAQVETSRSRLAAAQQELERLKSSTGNTTREQQALEQQIGQLNRALEQAETKEQAAARGVNEWTRQNNYAQRDLNNLSREIEENNGYLEEARNSVDGCAQSIDEYGQAVRNAGNDSGDLGSSASGAIDTMASALESAGISDSFEKIRDTLIECTEKAMDFESDMTQVYALLPGRSKESYQQLKEDMLQFSEEMNIMTTESVPAFRAALSAGVDSENIFSLMTTAQKSAVGGAVALGTAMDGLTGIVNAYGDSNLDAQQSADMMFKAVELGKTNFELLSEAMNDLAPTAADAGVGFDHVAAAMAAITARQVPASEAGQQLNQLLEELSDSGSEVGRIFEEVAGTSFQKFMEQGGSLQGALQELEEYAWQSGSGIQELFSSVEAGDAAFALTGAATESFTDALDKMRNSTGAMDAAYNTMTGTAEYASQEVQAACNNVMTAIGDALLPAFQNLAQGAAAGLNWAAEFIEKNPWIVAAVGAAAAALGVLSAAVAGYSLAMEVVIPLVKAFNLALTTGSPFGLVALAIGAAAAALTTFCVISGSAVDQTRELSQSIKENREAYEESIASVEKQNDSVMGMVGALETLSGKQNRTAAEQATFLQLIDDLNEAVPELSLAYDEETNSLNMTAEAIREMALAEAERAVQAEKMERLKALYVESAEIETQLKDATEKLAQAEAERAEKTEHNLGAMGPAVSQAMEMSGALNKEKQAVAQLTNMQNANKEELEKLQAEYDSYADSLDNASGAGADQEKQNKTLEKTGQQLTATTKSLIAGEDMLTKAFREQKETGELSLDTILSLVAAGKTNMLTVDSETGAVRLNTQAYIENYTQKINDQIESLKIQRTSAQTAQLVNDEALRLLGLSESYIAVARSKSVMNGQVVSTTAQINALEKLKKNITSYSGTRTRAAAVTKKAAQAEKTQAEKDLEEFKKLKAALDHEKAMDQKSDGEYYSALAQYRDRYLKDAANVDTLRGVNESIYKYERGLLDEQLKNYETHLQGMSDTAADTLQGIQDKYKDVLAQQEELREKLSDYGELFEIKDDKVKVSDLKEQSKVLDEYKKTLDELKKGGLSDGLMNEILGMDVDSALAYGKELLELKETDQLETYNKDWEEKQNKAKEIAEEFYSTELQTLETEYNSKLNDALSSLKDTSYTSGLNTGQSLLQGLSDKEDELYAKARTIARRIAQELQAAYSMAGSEDKKKKSGSHADGLDYVPFDGYMAELHRGEMVLTASEAKAYITASMPSSFAVPSKSQAMGEQAAALVNAIGTLTAGMDRSGMAGDLTVVVPVNGVDLARATIRDFREVSDQSPRVAGGFV